MSTWTDALIDEAYCSIVEQRDAALRILCRADERYRRARGLQARAVAYREWLVALSVYRPLADAVREEEGDEG